MCSLYFPTVCASRFVSAWSDHCAYHTLSKQASPSRHYARGTMPGTRAQALAPLHRPEPDEAEPDPIIPRACARHVL